MQEIEKTTVSTDNCERKDVADTLTAIRVVARRLAENEPDEAVRIVLDAISEEAGHLARSLEIIETR